MKYLDMLAKLGIGNAHPGGFKETLQQLEQFPLPAGARVLEVGCGTGRTACLLAQRGFQVTALDIRPEMIAKGRIRAQAAGVQVAFVEGDACMLPFAPESFDVVLVESVTNFTEAERAAAEYFRVLAPGGQLYDREVLLQLEPPEEAYRELVSYYDVRQLLGVTAWERVWSAAGFASIAFSPMRPFPQSMWEDAVEHPDPVQLSDQNALWDPEIWQMTHQYEDLMERYGHYLGYSLMIAKKSGVL
ncbi:class I SAM-dependent methyltransferase [Paenibacillus athensensis]|uniref:Methyltransferase type 11 domain-containing protein n=1 Tax=Paenibacillus athensensis TaxID=1967502 RepID=A0A4Y8PXS3_9BACL|nr:class I SAM-dependent methyltransferase [Paenibacillus athensensis]